jgi:hypothetical protein
MAVPFWGFAVVLSLFKRKNTIDDWFSDLTVSSGSTVEKGVNKLGDEVYEEK